jgi:hypothetical protein
MNVTKLVEDIVIFHQDSIKSWDAEGINLSGAGLLRLVAENHAFNFKLWRAEDRARREDKGYEFVYAAKREIDYCNQQRNNKMEEMDFYLYEILNPSNDLICKVHSETPGMMVDRLSILSLKHYHMNIQVQRDDVTNAHLDKCMQKLQTIFMQKNQLEKCLIDFLQEIITKTRTFKVYHQFKMYNDPELNPELYANKN